MKRMMNKHPWTYYLIAIKRCGGCVSYVLLKKEFTTSIDQFIEKAD
jgi:hypothetical protein